MSEQAQRQTASLPARNKAWQPSSARMRVRTGRLGQRPLDAVLQPQDGAAAAVLLRLRRGARGVGYQPRLHPRPQRDAEHWALAAQGVIRGPQLRSGQ